MKNKKTDRMKRLPCGSMMQYGPMNDRIYLIKVGKEATDQLPDALLEFAKQEGLSKIFAKVPAQHAAGFEDEGYLEEARVPRFFNGRQDAYFFGYFLDPTRAHEPAAARLDEIQELALNQKTLRTQTALDPRFHLRACRETDVQAMAHIYHTVFPSYPFPIHDPAYLLETMQSHVAYYGVETEGQLVALASAEQDIKAANAEMTDFATMLDWRGHRFAQHLLTRMEQDMAAKGIKTVYTIARSYSPGMNVTFSRGGYCFGGRLKNNTNIAGCIESMNVWHKPLQQAG